MSYKFARTDANHKEIVDHFRSLGFHVLDISKLKNCCDLVVTGYGKTFFVEVKDGDKPESQKKLTPGEELFRRGVLQYSGTFEIIENKQQVNELFINLQKRTKNC